MPIIDPKISDANISASTDVKHSEAVIASNDVKKDLTSNATAATATSSSPSCQLIDKDADIEFSFTSLRVTITGVSKFCVLCCCEPFARTLFKNAKIAFSTRIGKSLYFVKTTFEEKAVERLAECLSGSLVFISTKNDSHCGVVLQEEMQSLCMDVNCFAPRCIRPNLLMIYRVLFLLICQSEGENPQCTGFQDMVTRLYGIAIRDIRSPEKVQLLIDKGIRSGAPAFITKISSESDSEDDSTQTATKS